MNKKIISLLLLAELCNTAQARTIEDLAVDNSDYSLAQVVETIDFNKESLNIFGYRGIVNIGASTIIDNDNADYYSFNIIVPTILNINIFTPGGPFLDDDPILGLYDSVGNQLINDDDSGEGFDSFLTYHFSTPGTYIAAVSGADDFDFDGITDFEIATDFQYTLRISAVPIPTSFWLLSSSLVGLIQLNRRKRANIFQLTNESETS